VEVPSAVSADLVVKAQGGVAPAVGVPVERGVVLLADAAVVLLRRCSAFMMCLLPAAC
jgi:hypothetical protein